MPMYDDLGNKFLTLPEQVNKNKKDIKAIQDAGISVEPAGEPGDIQFNEDDALGASANLHWDMVNERLGVGTNEPAEKLHVVGKSLLGDVGIGTTSPRQALDVNGAIIAKNVVSNGLAAHPTGIGPYVETYINALNTGRLFCYDGSTYYDLAIGDWSTSNPNIMLKVGGNVGIGIVAPTERLHVAGKVKANDGFVGNLVGNVTGDVTGTASGNLPDDADLDDLDNVDISSPSDGQILKYDSTSGTWKNETGAVLSGVSDDFTDYTEETAPVGNDTVVINDSTDSGNVKRVKLSNLSTRSQTLLGNTTSTSNTITLTVADIHDYDEIRVQYHTRKGSGTTADPYFYGISSVTTDSSLWGYYNNTGANQFWRIGAELAAPNGNGESTFLNVQVLQNNADGTSVYIDIEGTRLNTFNIRVYGINH